MFSRVFQSSAFSNLRNRLRRGGHDVAHHEGEHAHDHHHELVIFTEGKPSKFQLFRWFFFILGTPTIATTGLYYKYVYPNYLAKKEQGLA